MTEHASLKQQLIEQRLKIHDLTKWKPRHYQKPPLDALRNGVKRVVAVWHRRAGKDTVFLNWTAEAMQQRPGVYWHMLPTAVQGRKVVWDGKTKEGKSFLDAFRDCGKQRRREDEMKITFEDINCVWQVVGSDKFDSLVGANPVGVVLSEYAVSDPRAWDYIRPILAENEGWACFPYTPRGRNHGSRLYEMAVENKNWFATLLTVEDTEVVPLIGDNSVQAEREAGMSDEMIAQEFYCSWDAPLHGSFYAKQMGDCIAGGRICEVKPDPNVETFTSFDLGISDSTSIWWWQFVGQEIHLIDYYENNGEPISHYARVLDERKELHGLVYGGHTWPHDGAARSLETGQKLNETFSTLGYEATIQGRHNILAGIDKVRGILHRCWFDKERCHRGIEALKAYQREEDEKKGTRHGAEIVRFFKPSPLHNWASHSCFSGDTRVLTRNGMCQIMDLPKIGEVLTLCGWKPYVNPRITKRDAVLVEVAFRNGYTVKCTPDHLFKTVSGWKCAGLLTPNTVIQSGSILSQFISTVVYTGVTRVINIGREVARPFIERYGPQPSDISQMVATSTTATTIPTTTYWPTSNVLTQRNISVSHGRDVPNQTRGGSQPARERKLRSGMVLRRAVFGTAGTLKRLRIGLSGNANLSHAKTVVKKLCCLFVNLVTPKGFVARIANRNIIAGVRLLNGRQEVWDLTVPGEHHFALANGAIVHNCDAFRYGAMAIDSLPSVGWQELVYPDNHVSKMVR